LLSLNGTTTEFATGMSMEIRNYIPEAVRCLSFKKDEAVFKLPFYTTHSFPDLIHWLQQNKSNLSINSFQLRATTLEEVFLSLMEAKDNGQAHSEQNAQNPMLEMATPITLGISLFHDHAKAVFSAHISASCLSSNLVFAQFQMICWRRWLVISRDRWSFCAQLLLPTLMMGLTLSMLLTSLSANQKEISLSPREYAPDWMTFTTKGGRQSQPKDHVVFASNNSFPNENDQFVRLFMVEHRPLWSTTGWNMSAEKTLFHPELLSAVNSSMLSSMLLDDSLFRDQRLVGVVHNDKIATRVTSDVVFPHKQSTVWSPSYTLLHNSSWSPHAIAIFDQVLRETIHALCLDASVGNINKIGNTLTPQFVEVFNHPMTFRNNPNLTDWVTASIITAMFLLIPIGYLSASFAGLIVSDRMSKSKQLMTMSFVTLPTYWFCQYACDLAIYVFETILLILCFHSVGEHQAASVFIGSAESELAMWGLLLSYGLASLPWTYLIVRHVDVPATAIVLVTSINVLTGFGFVLLYFILLSISNPDK
jgi:hypothetical protein